MLCQFFHCFTLCTLFVLDLQGTILQFICAVTTHFQKHHIDLLLYCLSLSLYKYFSPAYALRSLFLV
jgi:hypothetical protein